MQAMVPYHQQFLEDAVEAVVKGYVPMSRLDLAVTRVLALKQRLGYFPPSWSDKDVTLDRLGPCSTPIAKLQDVPDDVRAHERAQSLQAARDGVVLLKNCGGVLPLEVAAGEVVAVVGPNAQNAAHLLGAWSCHWQGPTNETEVRTSVLVVPSGGMAAEGRDMQVPFDDVATSIGKWMAGKGGVAVAATGVTTDGEPVHDRCLTVAAVASKAIMCASVLYALRSARTTQHAWAPQGRPGRVCCCSMLCHADDCQQCCATQSASSWVQIRVRRRAVRRSVRQHPVRIPADRAGAARRRRAGRGRCAGRPARGRIRWRP